MASRCGWTLTAALLLAVAPGCNSLHETARIDGRVEPDGRKSLGRLAFSSKESRMPLVAAIGQTAGKQLKFQNNNSQVAAAIAGPALLGYLGFAACFGRDPSHSPQQPAEAPNSAKPFAASLMLLPVLLVVLPLLFNLHSRDLARIAKGAAQHLPKGFVEAISLILFSELGDKTFFVAGLFAMKSSPLISFAGSLGALACMTVFAVLIGQIFQRAPTLTFMHGVALDRYCAVAAFSYFGLTLLYEAWAAESGSEAIESELQGAEEELSKKEGVPASVLALVLQAFSLVFAAEVGDRSFFATIAMSTAYSPVGVAAGAVAGHAISTGIAVITGSYLAKVLSTRFINGISGLLFVAFALTTALGLF